MPVILTRGSVLWVEVVIEDNEGVSDVPSETTSSTTVSAEIVSEGDDTHVRPAIDTALR